MSTGGRGHNGYKVVATETGKRKQRDRPPDNSVCPLAPLRLIILGLPVPHIKHETAVFVLRQLASTAICITRK